MPVIDPSGFQIIVTLTNAEGDEFVFWEGGAMANGWSIFRDQQSEFQDLPIVQSVQIDLNQGLNGSLSVELGATYELGLALLDSQLFTIGNKLTVEIGYPKISLWLPPFSTIAIKPSISINPQDGLTATLNGAGGMFASMRGGAPEQFQNSSIKDVIEVIGARNHNRWTLEFPDREGDADPLYIPRRSISRSSSEWEFVRRMIGEAHCAMFMRPQSGGTRIIVRRTGAVVSSEPVTTFVCRGQIDMLNRFPLESIESEMENVWLPSGSDASRTADIDPTDRSEPTAERTQESRASDGEQPLTDAAVGDGYADDPDIAIAQRPGGDQGGEHTYASAADQSRSPQEVVDQRQGDEAGRGGGIQATIGSIGIPTIMPQDVVRLEGIGIFNGNYVVQGINHTVSAGQWDMSLRLMRDSPAGSQFIADRIATGFQDFNNQEAPQQTDAESGGAFDVEANTDLSEAELADLTGLRL